MKDLSQRRMAMVHPENRNATDPWVLDGMILELVWSKTVKRKGTLFRAFLSVASCSRTHFDRFYITIVGLILCRWLA